LTIVVIVATGMTAAPVRHALTPLIGQQLGPWLGHAPTTAPLLVAQSDVSASRDMQLEEPIGAPGPMSYSRTAAGHSAADHLAKAERESHSESDSARGHGNGRLNDRFSDLWLNRIGGSALSFPGGGDRIRAAGKNFTGNPQAAAAKSSASSNGSGRSNSGGGGSDHAADPKKGDNKPNDPPGLFNEHKVGLGELKGNKNGDDPGTAIGGGTVAVNPEPSTLFLFGTGMALAAGSIRRRLR